MSIPKIIHYCWFGDGKFTKQLKMCIKSWELYLPEYQFILWNEKNIELQNLFVKQAYKEKKWAFVSDYIRLTVLYKYGGIYLDTDMLLIKNFDNLLNHHFFIAAETETFLNAAVIGTEANNGFILKCINEYDKIVFDSNDLKKITIPKVITNTFYKIYGCNHNFDKKMNVDDIFIYPKEYFYPMPYTRDIIYKKEATKYATKNTYAIHLWSKSWVEFGSIENFKRGNFILGFKLTLKEMFINRKIEYKNILEIYRAIKYGLIKQYKN